MASIHTVPLAFHLVDRNFSHGGGESRSEMLHPLKESLQSRYPLIARAYVSVDPVLVDLLEDESDLGPGRELASRGVLLGVGALDRGLELNRELRDGRPEVLHLLLVGLREGGPERVEAVLLRLDQDRDLLRELRNVPSDVAVEHLREPVREALRAERSGGQSRVDGMSREVLLRNGVAGEGRVNRAKTMSIAVFQTGLSCLLAIGIPILELRFPF